MAETFSKDCDGCGARIRFSKLDDQWIPFDDHGRHRCASYGATSTKDAQLETPREPRRDLGPPVLTEVGRQRSKIAKPLPIGCVGVIAALILLTLLILRLN